MCYNEFTIKIKLFRYKRLKHGRCAYENVGSSHLKLLRQYRGRSINLNLYIES